MSSYKENNLQDFLRNVQVNNWKWVQESGNLVPVVGMMNTIKPIPRDKIDDINGHPM